VPEGHGVLLNKKMLNRRVILYNPKLKQYARELRKNGTLSEVLLWNKLKRKQVLGYDFGRQKPIDEYIVDFFCLDLRLAIEIDGITHTWKEQYDEVRQKKLEEFGIKFLRFTEKDIRSNLIDVVHIIEEWIKKNENDNEES
jgi:very-short-patch-repair endonuclease